MADSETDPEPRPETRFYPLDAPSLPFARYGHAGLTERDLMVHSIMAYYMNPTRPKAPNPRRYMRCMDVECDRSDISSHRVTHDMRVLTLCLFTYQEDQDCKTTDPMCQYFPVSLEGPSSLCPPSTNIFLDMAMRHYLETDDSAMRAWLADTGWLEVPRAPPKHSIVAREVWDSEGRSMRTMAERAQLRQDRSLIETLADSRLYNGDILAPTLRRGLDELDIGMHKASRIPAFRLQDLHGPDRLWDSVPIWPEVEKYSRHMVIPEYGLRFYLAFQLDRPKDSIKDFNINPGRGRDRDGHWSTGRASPSATADGRYARGRRRCTSLPPPGSFASADIPAYGRLRLPGELIFMFPRMRVSQLDRRSRRRSLSRTRIEELFDWDVNVPNPRDQTSSPKPGRLTCHNCLQPGHQHTSCPSPCGYCGTISRLQYNELYQRVGKRYSDAGFRFLNFLHTKPHAAPDCPVSPKNRCKCIAFPTYHTAKDCRITCHRDCGNPAGIPGSLRHRNAMLCKSRCCMCGIRGHSGRECTHKKCRCGGHHLGQDCCWNPTCRVEGCDRFLCGVHCRECGSAEGKPFRDRKCWRCYGADGPFEWTKQRRRRTRKNYEQALPDEGEENTGELSAEGENAEVRRITILPSSKEGEDAIKVATNTIFNNPGWSFSGLANRESSSS
ncbi:hypothetical protein V8F20_009373 [Naviculisporaceae sp. PSN 640]